ncbi:MAG TPA: SRPBCC domain-containing protein [Acidimicrobiales bacterium]|nr:SRPBCC domain-containing protein [Acidimicrobiales bacterium]
MELAPASVSRSIVLPAPADEVWASLRDADGLAGWLGDAVDLDVVPGAAGTVVDGGVVRRVVVTEVVEGRSLGLVWWDEAAPEEASVVTIALAPGEADGDTTVTVTERLAGSAVASVAGARIDDLAAVEASWDQRLQALVGESALAPACV